MRRVAVALRPLATLAIGAVLASWLLPIAVLRYQRLASIRDEVAKQLDSASLQVTAIETASRSYAERLDAYWAFVLESQFRQLELDEQRSTQTKLILDREQARIDADASDAREKYRSAQDEYYRRAAAFETWALQTGETLARYFPSDDAQIRAVFAAAATRVRASSDNARRREMGFGIVVHLRAEKIRELSNDFRRGRIVEKVYRAKLAELDNVSVKSGPVATTFPQVLRLTRDLRAEAPSPQD